MIVTSEAWDQRAMMGFASPLQNRRTPAHDRVVLLLSWLVTTLFCHFVLFAFQKVRHRPDGK